MWTIGYSRDTFIALPSLLGVTFRMQQMELSLLEEVPSMQYILYELENEDIHTK